VYFSGVENPFRIPGERPPEEPVRSENRPPARVGELRKNPMDVAVARALRAERAARWAAGLAVFGALLSLLGLAIRLVIYFQK